MSTLDAVVIAKNEARFLEKSLSSIVNVVDNIVFVDTGSSDATLDIAKRFTDQIYHFPWIDDFSAAHNESVRHAKSEYVLQWDADFYIDPKNAARLTALKQNNFRNLDGIALRWLTIDTSKKVVLGSVERMLIFKRGLYAYKSPVHAYLEANTSAATTGSDPAITIEHHKDSKKAYRTSQTAAIIERSLKENNANEFLTAHHVSALVNEGSYAEAFDVSERYLHEFAAINPYRYADVLEKRAIALLQTGKIRQAYELVFTEGIDEHIVCRPALRIIRADILVHMQELSRAIQEYYQYTNNIAPLTKKTVANHIYRQYVHPYRMIALLIAERDPLAAKKALQHALAAAKISQDKKTISEIIDLNSTF